jgi:AraC family transcriptional regulator
MYKLIADTSIKAYAPHFRQATHHHDTASVSLVLRGMLRETACRTEVTARPLSLVVKPAGVPHADVFGPEPVTTCQILLRPEVHDCQRWRDAVSRWRWVVGGPGVRAALGLARALRAPDADLQELRENVAAVLDALGGHPRLTSAPGWLPRIIGLLQTQIAGGAEHIRVAEAAAVAGVHPVHLSRVFQGHFGCTVSAWIRRRRVQWAAAQLAATDRPLSEVASRAGFADHSHMNRTFRRETALLPSEFRRFVGAA